MVSTILLCAGQSRRMGRSKLLLPLKDKKVIDYVLFNLLNSNTTKIVVVARKNDKEFLKHIPNHKKIEIVFNNLENADMFSSVVCGTQFLKKDTLPLMIFLGEHPLIDSKTINILIDAFLNSEKRIVMPVYEGIKGHPLILDNSLKNEILSPKIRCLKDIIKKHQNEILEVDVDCRGVVIDLDTEEDYKKMLEEIENGYL
ncbi:MAG: nucleotidyltransferase family protein [Candidatus Schekmanbacteria bacterium]|nr:MAG: nucleotidyltransferase family protein [Candidatus Schekmanbacteria bacterium]